MPSIRTSTTATIATMLLASSTLAAPLSPDPWDFGVFALSNIGSGSVFNPGEIAGLVGAVGNLAIQSNLIHSDSTIGVGAGASVYAGGNVRALGTILGGGIEAGGYTWLTFATVNGNVYSGGDLYWLSFGTINGDANLGGTDRSFLPVTITGAVNEGVVFSPTVNLNSYASFFTTFSQDSAAASDNAAFVDSGGALSIVLTAGQHAASITAQQLASASSISISGPVGASLVINVSGADIIMNDIAWALSGGVGSSGLVLNFADASTVTINAGAHQARVLAPLAAVNFVSGSVLGSLTSSSLIGAGSVLAAVGSASPLVPESGPLALTSIALVLVVGYRDRR